MPFFPAVTIDGRAAFLCLPAADWTLRPKVAHQFGTLDAQGGTGIEAVASEHHDVRLTQTLQLTLQEAQAQQLLTFLLGLTEERLAVPLANDAALPAGDYATLRCYVSTSAGSLGSPGGGSCGSG